MSVIQGILLGILQGIAEFLPISSSGHLAVAQNIFGLDDLPLLFDVFLHLATLAAVCLYFWRKIWELLKCFGRWISRSPKVKENSKDYDVVLAQKDLANRKIIIAIILSTIVTGVMGIFSSKLIPNLSIKVTCCGFLVTSLFLILSSVIEKRNSRLAQNSDDKKNPNVSKVQALIIGFMQGIGTLPGISRSGSTIAGALFCGVDRSLAGEYSFIISIPAILGAFILELKDLGEVSSSIGAAPVIAGCAAAFATGYISLTFLMKMIKKGKLQYFTLYLIPLAILGLIFLK
ncbi:MAG: undecaprenyl-diphosphate phosphatase [Treponema sp.]|nr:undecaprenyl-diphosphate phosphatase [Treponema sp.]